MNKKTAGAAGAVVGMALASITILEMAGELAKFMASERHQYAEGHDFVAVAPDSSVLLYREPNHQGTHPYHVWMDLGGVKSEMDLTEDAHFQNTPSSIGLTFKDLDFPGAMESATITFYTVPPNFWSPTSDAAGTSTPADTLSRYLIEVSDNSEFYRPRRFDTWTDSDWGTVITAGRTHLYFRARLYDNRIFGWRWPSPTIEFGASADSDTTAVPPPVPSELSLTRVWFAAPWQLDYEFSDSVSVLPADSIQVWKDGVVVVPGQAPVRVNYHTLRQYITGNAQQPGHWKVTILGSSYEWDELQ